MRESETETRSFYEREALGYDGRWGKPGGAYTAAAQASIVKELCSSWGGKRILEIGCGTGRFSALLYSVAGSLAVVDASLAMLRTTRELLARVGARTVEAYVNASAYGLPFDCGSFDAVASINVFSHLGCPLDALKEAARVLAPSGRLLVNFPNGRGYFLPVALAVNARRKALGRRVFSAWYSPGTILRMIGAAGYEVVSMRGHVHVPVWLDVPIARSVLRVLDRASRDSWLARYAPIWFVQCRKAS